MFKILKIKVIYLTVSTHLLGLIQTLTALTEHVSAARDHLCTTPCFSSSADMLRLLLNSTILNTQLRHTLKRNGDDTLRMQQ